jgi:5,6-dimethylbenzimidazole synthase
MEHLLDLAGLAPSVGLSQPWRFVLVNSLERRAAIKANFERCNVDALAAQPAERVSQYARLKLAGLDEAPCHVAVLADRSTAQGHGLGRRTMPEMIEYSAVMAVYTLWLLARAQGVGLGWVSILDPKQVISALDVPEAWTFIGYLCLGYPDTEDNTPTLVRAGWEQRTALKACRIELQTKDAKLFPSAMVEDRALLPELLLGSALSVISPQKEVFTMRLRRLGRLGRMPPCVVHMGTRLRRTAKLRGWSCPR